MRVAPSSSERWASRSSGRSGRASARRRISRASWSASRHGRRRGVGRMRRRPRSRLLGGVQRGRLARAPAGSWCRRCSRPATSRPTTSTASWRRPRPPDGEGHADRRGPGRRAARRGGDRWPRTSARRAIASPCGVSVGITPTTDELLRPGGRVSRRGLPADQAEDRARDWTSSACARSARRIPDILLSGRRQRRLHRSMTPTSSWRSTSSTC